MVELDWQHILSDAGADRSPWQDRVVASLARHVIIRAARRTGKSYSGAKRIFTKVIAQPRPSRGWIVGPSYDLAEKEFRYLLQFTRKFCLTNGMPKPQDVRHNAAAGDLYFRTPWGAEVIGKSAQKPEMLVGEELDWLLMSEAAMHSERTWGRYLRATLTDRKGISVWPFTPDAGGYWLYDLELNSETSPDWEIFTLPAWECDHYDRDEIEAARRDLNDDEFAEQYGGEWRFYTGRVYRGLKADIHIVKPFDIPASWKVFAATDFGLRDPTCTLWLAKSPTGEAYLVDEYYKPDRALEDHIAEMKKQQVKHEIPEPCVRIGDHHGLGGQLIRDAGRYGWPTVACKSHDRNSRRNRALSALALRTRKHPYHVREWGQPVGEEGEYPELFIFNRCENLLKEMKFLRFKETVRKEGTAGDTEGEDHACDAMEYLVEYVNLGVTLRSRQAKRQGEYVGWNARPQKPLRYVGAQHSNTRY